MYLNKLAGCYKKTRTLYKQNPAAILSNQLAVGRISAFYLNGGKAKNVNLNTPISLVQD